MKKALITKINNGDNDDDEESNNNITLDLGQDDYDPKSHKNDNNDKPLSFIEKLLIIIGSLIFVLILVSIKHPNIYKKESYSSNYISQPRRIMSINDTRIIGYASDEGTRLFAKDNGFDSLGFNILGNECDAMGIIPCSNTLKNQHGLYISAIGIGTYLGDTSDNDDQLVIHAILESVLKGGINMIDTAINYRGQKAERCIKIALRKIFTISKTITRDSLFISTKGGFIPSDSDKQWNGRRTAAEWASSSVVKFPNEEIVDNKHCIAPICLEKSINASLSNLGLETIDLFYLHNVAEKQLPLIPRDDVMKRLEKAFEYLEQVRSQGVIRFYGLATWTCFRVNPSDPQYLSLNDVNNIAIKVGGENHGFRFIQVPLTSSMPEAATEKFQDGVTLLEKAVTLKITVISSRSIGMANAKSIVSLDESYYECMNVNGISHIDKASKVPDGAALSLQIVRSTPGLASALVGMKKVEHVEENCKVLKTKKVDKAVVACIYANEEKGLHYKKENEKEPKELKKGYENEKLVKKKPNDKRKKTHRKAAEQKGKETQQ